MTNMKFLPKYQYVMEKTCIEKNKNHHLLAPRQHPKSIVQATNLLML